MTAQHIVLDTFADHGMWISHDRIFAFVGIRGVHSVGWHGLQPVSRNARMLHDDEGAIVCERRVGVQWTPVTFTHLDWLPDHCIATSIVDGGELALHVVMRGCAMTITLHGASALRDACRLRIRLSARVTAVQGERIWTTGQHDDEICLHARDRIMLHAWIRRTGPYAGDFLIPEYIRRRIFARTCRSGDATVADLRDEYRDADFPLYDAESRLHVTAADATCELDSSSIIAPARAALQLRFTGRDSLTQRTLSCEQADATPRRADITRASDHAARATAPDDSHTSFPHTAAWRARVPALFDTCIIRDIGVPRACPGSYYWIWAWDAMVAAHAALAWGRTDTAEATARFITSHRDIDGCIPMRWTRAWEPLDTPGHGALEALHLVLVRDTVLATGDVRLLDESWHHYAHHFERIAAISDREGRFPSLGFYPDFPRALGRSEHTAVAMEVGMHAVFCSILADLAAQRDDRDLAERARAQAELIRRGFLHGFLDGECGLLADAVDRTTGTRTDAHPLFTLLFLIAPEGWVLLGDHVDALADAIARHHLTEHGFRTMPAWDARARSESVSNAWYPHWDRYAIALLQRAGRHAEILRWRDAVERTLAHLGYCPEFLTMDDFDPTHAACWRRHGAASNLTGVTAWHACLTQLDKETHA